MEVAIIIGIVKNEDRVRSLNKNVQISIKNKH